MRLNVECCHGNTCGHKITSEELLFFQQQCTCVYETLQYIPVEVLAGLEKFVRRRWERNLEIGEIADEALPDDEDNRRDELGGSEGFPEPVRMVSAVMEDASGLQRLVLDDYEQHLENRGRGCLYETVKTIAIEFHGPYKDYRHNLVSQW